MGFLEDDSDGTKASPPLAELLEGKLERVQGISPPKIDWRSVPAPRPITDEKMQRLYATICHGFTARYKLERVEVPLLAIIGAAADSEREGWCYMSQASLAKLCGVSIPTVRGGLKRLGAKGLLEKGSWTRGETLHIRLSPQARRERQNYKNVYEQQRLSKKRV